MSLPRCLLTFFLFLFLLGGFPAFLLAYSEQEMPIQGVCESEGLRQPSPVQSEEPLLGRGMSSVQFLGRQKESTSKLALTFKDITYTLPKCSGRSEILCGISGYVRSGEMLAILGPSGAGKSTLLDILAKRTVSGEVGGEVLLNGRAIKDAAFRRITAYVQQVDVMQCFLTVRETISYAAQLRTPPSFKRREVRARVEEVMRQLGIDGIQNKKIGSDLVRGISGGEKKRCAIAIELVASPSLIFLDEPTTGLDAFTALHLMKIFKELTSLGTAVVFSIHQPRSSCFALFDRLLLLNGYGEEVYFGPAGEAMSFFAQIGVVPSAPENPADFLLDSISVPPEEELLACGDEARLCHVACGQSAPNIAAAFRDRLLEGIEREIDAIDDTFMQIGSETSMAKDVSPYFRSVWTQIRVVSMRGVINKIRDPMAVIVTFAASIFFALLTGSVYFRLGLDQPSIRNRMGVLFFIVMNTSLHSVSVLNLLMEDRPLLLREHRNGMYRPVAFFIGKIVQDLPIKMVSNFVFDTIAYFMVGLQPRVDKFLLFCLICFIIMLNGYTFCLLVSTVSKNIQVANILAPLVVVVYLLPSGGVLMSVEAIPLFWKWIKYISFVRYGLTTLVINEFDGLKFNCSPDDVICVRDGKLYAEMQGFYTKDFWRFIGAAAGSVGVYLLLAYIGLVLVRTRGSG
ncbi:ATP-binding cassette protein, putative [Trypanosoma cruzi]|uniref:ATP-binding cassette protein, putative n=2 Tax=Trypanosoma cruzi TaxID=5693 RepID=Q4DW41_TRYCC|nr:ATP-binding cassette protein, putative [Trypanosoma cruzi]EAN96748.1 ATP-binding cassette protein, putative [Trypanosoma cruzi]|eukprot:XP_818599.1 ATP-binding cassette protein [Trypanosoma cruzi strain CL Brener]